MSAHAQTMTDNNKTNFLTVDEVSSILRLSTLTIYKYIKEGKISAFEFGGHYRIDSDSLDKFIELHKLTVKKEETNE